VLVFSLGFSLYFLFYFVTSAQKLVRGEHPVSFISILVLLLITSIPVGLLARFIYLCWKKCSLRWVHFCPKCGAELV